jgi:hypothetical protein
MIALIAFWRLKQNGNGKANANNNKSWPKSLIVSDYSRIQYYKLVSQCYDDRFACFLEAQEKRQWRSKRQQQQIMAEKPDRL